MIYRSRVHISADELKYIEDAIENGGMGEDETIKIGRASCRERVCHEV